MRTSRSLHIAIRVSCILALCTGFAAGVIACTGSMEVTPWTRPGGTYGGDDEPTTSTNATEPIDGSAHAAKKADAATVEEEPGDATAAPADAAHDGAALKDAGVG